MKKIVGLLFLVATFFNHSLAQADCGYNDCGYNDCGYNDCCSSTGCLDSFSVQARYAAFFPLESRMRDVYHDALPCLELEASMRVWDCVQGFFNAGYVWDSGKSIGLGNKTTFSLVPLSLGLKWVQPVLCNVDAYIGLGATYSFVKMHDHSPYVHERVYSQNFGGILKTGFVYKYSDCVFFEGFFDYFYTRFTFPKSKSVNHYVERHDLNISAVKLGVGIGYNF